MRASSIASAIASAASVESWMRSARHARCHAAPSFPPGSPARSSDRSGCRTLAHVARSVSANTALAIAARSTRSNVVNPGGAGAAAGAFRSFCAAAAQNERVAAAASPREPSVSCSSTAIRCTLRSTTIGSSAATAKEPMTGWLPSSTRESGSRTRSCARSTATRKTPSERTQRIERSSVASFGPKTLGSRPVRRATWRSSPSSTSRSYCSSRRASSSFAAPGANASRIVVARPVARGASRAARIATDASWSANWRIATCIHASTVESARRLATSCPPASVAPPAAAGHGRWPRTDCTPATAATRQHHAAAKIRTTLGPMRGGRLPEAVAVRCDCARPAQRHRRSTISFAG